MLLIQEIRKKAKKINATIVLPEANIDKRVYDACEYVLKNNLSDIIVFGKDNEFGDTFKTKHCKIIDIEKFDKIDEFASQLYELRKHKGMTIEEANKLIKQADYFSMMLVKNNMADGVVAGAVWSTANTLRPALQIIKTKPDKKLVVGAMLMVKDGVEPLVFADISLNENPTSEQLSEIAISSAEFMDKVVGLTPRVAMLSYSTKGSAKSEMVDKVVNATNMAKSKSNYYIDGEMQADSALDTATAKRKGVSEEVGGRANVLIFPDLNVGNISYKLVARLGGYKAIGPIMLNFNKPVNDLSRGCTTDEIIDTLCITKLLAQK